MQQRNDPGKSVSRPGRAADNSGRRATGFELDEKKKKAFDKAMEKIRLQNADDSSKIAYGVNQRGQDIYNRLNGNIFMTEADRRQLSNDIIAYNSDLKRLKFYGYDVDGLMDISSQYDDIMSMRNGIYSQFANERDYNAAVLSGGVYEDGTAARGEIYQKNKNRISELEKILSEGENEAAQEELDALRMMNTAYERGMKTVDDYKVYTQNSDFGWRSKQRDYGNPTAEYAEEYRRRFDQDTIRYDPVAGGLVNQFGEIVNNDLYAKYDAPVVQDKLGAFLNGDVEHSRLQKTNGVASALDEAVAEGDELGWRFLKEDEIGTYYYIYSKDGKEAAEKYLKDMQITLSRREEQEFQDEISNAGNLELALYNLASIPINVIGGAAEGINYLVQTAAGNTEDFNPYDSMTRQAGIIRGEAAKRIEEESGGFNIAGFSYGDAFQSLMSGADSALGAAIGGHAYTVLMGAGAAKAEATRLWEMGASQDQITAGALTAGVAEAAFEYLSIDNFLKMKDPKTISQVIKNILVQGGVEASEEMATELANTVTNGIIMGSQSDWNTEIRRMMETEGISQAEAGAKYISGKLWEAGMGGFISGGAMAGPASAVNYTANVANQKAIGQNIRENGGIEALRQLANNSVGISSETATRKEARMQSSAQKAVQKALEQSSQEPGSNRALGLLSQQVDNLRSVQNRTDVVTALMKDAGMNRWQARKAADTISAIAEYRAEEADIKAYNKLMENDKVSAVLDKLLGDDGAVSFRNLQHRFGRNGVMLTRGDNTASEGKLKNDTKNSMVSKIKAAEDKYDAADNGVTELKSTGEKIKSIRPESNNNGQLTFRVTTEAGETKTVGAEDVVFGSSDQATLYGVFADLGIDADSIAALAEGYSPGTDLTTYILGAQEAYTYGLYNMSAERGSFSQDLTKEQRLNAYQRGQIDAGRKVGRETAEIRKAIEKSKKTAGKKGGVVYEGNRADYQNLSDVQDTSVKVLSRLGEDMGITFHLYKSYVNSSGNRVYSTRDGEFTAPNGFYKDGEIWLDINAGNNGEGMILFTAAHEMTHFIKQWSPAKFKVLANFLVQQYGKQGQSVEQLVAAQIQKAKDNGRTLSYDEAFEEMVADSMETMLTDGTALQKMAELRSTDRGLWEKMKHWWASFAARVKRLYKSLNPDSEEGKLVRQMSEAVEQIRQLFVEGVADASENYNAVQMENSFESDGIATDDAGNTVAVQDENGHSVFSLRTYDDSGRTLLKKYLDGRVKAGDLTSEERNDMLKQMDELADICRKYTGEFAVFGNWSNAEIVERNGKPVFSVVKKNGEYALNLDFSLVCKKRRTLDAVFNSMISMGLMDNIDTLSEADISRINEIIREYGFETACALCFVDAKRYRQGLVADAFTGLYNQLVRSMAPDGAALSFFNYGGNKAVAATAGIESLPNSALNFDEINRVLATYGKSTVEYKAARLLKDNPSQRKLLLRGDFMSTAGLDAVKTQNPAILKLYNSKKGTGGPKAAESDVQYLSEIISRKAFNAKKAYSVGGVRIQSFSDYIPRLVFDYIQMVGDLAAKKLPAHAYTKEASFAMQFGMTGIKINMSLVPDVAEDGVAPGLDKNGNYLWRDGQSFGSDVRIKGSGKTGFDLAVQIQNAEGYGQNCGTIAVGISKQHIEKLLSDPNIRMVIPYHKSSLNHLVASMNNVDKFTDYTASQNTKLNGSKLPKGIADFNFNSALQRLGDAKAAANEYLAWCEKNGFTPKFEEFAWHENYYKLLEDFSCYDSNGNAAPQGAVRLNFPTSGDAFGSIGDLIREGLEEDAVLQGEQDKKVPQIVEAIRSEMTARGKVSKNTTDDGGVKYSIRSNVVDINGNVYDNVVVLDKQISERTLRDNKRFTAYIKRNLIGMKIRVVDNDGIPETIEFARESDSVTKNGNRHKVLGKIQTLKGDVRRTVIVNAEEAVSVSKAEPDLSSKDNSHLWLDENGWEIRISYVLTNDTIYKAFFQIAHSRDGRNILYSVDLNVDEGIAVDKNATSTNVASVKTAVPSSDDYTHKNVFRQDISNKESARDTAAQTTRSFLTSMDADALSNATEQKYLAEYQEADRQILEYQKQIGTMTEDLRELRSGKGKRNMSAIRTLQDEITKAENRINVLSGKMLRLEDGSILQRVLNRELKRQLDSVLKEQADSYENQLLLQEVSSDAEMKAQTALLKADKADALNTQKKKYEAELKEQNERLTKKLDELRANKKAALEKQRQKIREQVKIASDNAKQRHGDTLIRHKIQKLAKELNQRLLHPSEKRYVPAEFTKLTVSILDAINLDTGRSARLKEKIANLKVQYEELLKNPTYAMAYDDVFNDLLENLYATVGDTPVNKMTTSQLNMVHDVLRALSENIRYAARVIIGTEEHDAYVLAKEMTDETMAAKGGQNLYTKWLQASLRADVMFERLAGFKKDSTWSKVARMLDDGQLKVTQVIMEGSKIFSELANDKQLKTLSDTKNLVDIGLKDDQGNKLLITRGMMLSIYMHLQNDQNARHIMSGGLTVPNIEKYYDGKIAESYGIGHEIARGSSMELARLYEELNEVENDSDRDRIEEEIKQAKASGEAYVNSLTDAIEKQLTEYDRAWIKAAKVFFDDYSKRRLNEATMQMYHFEKAKERNYFPIHTDKNYRSANFESIARDMSLENAGFMKDRITGASSPILLEDITDVINIQLKRTATYVGLAPAIRSFHKIYGKTQTGYANSVQNAVATRFGTDGQKWIENLMADLTGSRSRETTIFDKIRGNMAAATLTLNPRVALAQTASFPTAAAELGWGPVMKALGKGGKNNHPFSRSDQELIEKYSPLLWYRMQGYSNTELGDIRNSQMLAGKVNRKLRFATGWIQAMDGATVGRLWYAAQYYVEDHFKALEKGSDDYYKKVAEVFNRVVEKTQPNYTVMQRPDILRNPNALLKQLTMFMTQRLQNFNIVYDAAARYTKYKADSKAGRNGVTAEDVKEARGNVIRAVSSQASAALTITLFKAAADVLLHMMDGYRDEDEELTAGSVSLRLLDTFCNSLISSALWGSEIYSLIASAVTKQTYDGITINAADVLNDALKGVLNMTDKISNGNVSFKDFYNLSTAITNVFGIPANNAYKIGRGIYQHIVDASNGEFFSFEAGVERTAVQNRELLYQAMVADDRERIEKFSNTFQDDRALHGAIREALRENDHQRIRDAAIARMSGNVEEYIRIVTEIKKEGHFIQDDIVAAVNSEITSIKNEEKKDEKQDASSQPLYSASDYMNAVDADQLSTAVSAKEWLMQKYMSEGKTEKEAERQFYSNVLSEIKDRYDTGIYSYDEAVKMLDGYGGLTLDDAQSRATKWKFNMENPGYEWTEPQVRNYYASAQPVGISIDVFQQFLDGYSECGGENKKDQVMEVIDSLPISSEQKDAIYLMYYAESTLHKTPWH